jgi:hypothetical protein
VTEPAAKPDIAFALNRETMDGLPGPSSAVILLSNTPRIAIPGKTILFRVAILGRNGKKSRILCSVTGTTENFRKR